MHNKTFPALLILLIVLLASCAKEGPQGPNGAQGPSFTGYLTGHVHLYDQYGSTVGGYLNYFSITIAGTGTVTSASTTVYPDATGYYIFALSTGTYSLSVADTSVNVLFAATQVNNINYLAGTLTQDIGMSAIPDTFINGFTSAKSIASLNDSLVLHVVPDTRLRNGLVFVNSSPLATGYILRYIVPIQPNATTATLLIPQQDLLNVGFTSGQMVYFNAYDYVVNDASVYENVQGQNVYNAINSTPFVDSAAVP